MNECAAHDRGIAIDVADPSAVDTSYLDSGEGASEPVDHNGTVATYTVDHPHIRHVRRPLQYRLSETERHFIHTQWKSFIELIAKEDSSRIHEFVEKFTGLSKEERAQLTNICAMMSFIQLLFMQKDDWEGRGSIPFLSRAACRLLFSGPKNILDFEQPDDFRTCMDTSALITILAKEFYDLDTEIITSKSSHCSCLLYDKDNEPFAIVDPHFFPNTYGIQLDENSCRPVTDVQSYKSAAGAIERKILFKTIRDVFLGIFSRKETASS